MTPASAQSLGAGTRLLLCFGAPAIACGAAIVLSTARPQAWALGAIPVATVLSIVAMSRKREPWPTLTLLLIGGEALYVTSGASLGVREPVVFVAAATIYLLHALFALAPNMRPRTLLDRTVMTNVIHRDLRRALVGGAAAAGIELVSSGGATATWTDGALLALTIVVALVMLRPFARDLADRLGE